MEDRFIRNIPAITEREQQGLRNKRVLIAGCGGTGAYLLEMAVRIGIGQIRFCDGDCFDSSNLNRQLLSTVNNIGRMKVEEAAERMRLIFPGIDVEPIGEFLSPDNADRMISGCDAVLDGLDTVKSRMILSAACEKAGIPYIYGAVGGWVAQAAVVMPGDRLIERIYCGSEEESSKAILSFSPALCASMELSLCVRLLCGRSLETGKLYILDLSEMDFVSI